MSEIVSAPGLPVPSRPLFMDFIIAIILGLANGRRAAAKGHSNLLWTFLSVLAFLLLEGIALTITLFALYGEFLRKNPLRTMEVFQDFAANMTWSRSLLFPAVGFGGYLLIRFILEKMPPNRAGGTDIPRP